MKHWRALTSDATLPAPAPSFLPRQMQHGLDLLETPTIKPVPSPLLIEACSESSSTAKTPVKTVGARAGYRPEQGVLEIPALPSILEGEVAGPTYGAADDRGSNGWKRPWFADTGRVTEFSVALSALTAWNTDGPFDEPGDEAGYDFLDGKVVMEEVRKQVKAALDERESEMKRLHDENQELRQVVMALSEREFSGEGGGQNSGVLMEGSIGPRGGEPRGNPTLERRDAVAVGRAPPGLSAQSPVPGGEPFTGASLEAPPGLQRQVEYPVSSVGRMSRLLAPTGLSAQSPVPGGDPVRCAPSDGHGGFQGQWLAGDVGGAEPPLAPAGLLAQSPVPGGNPSGDGSKSADPESQNGLLGTSGHGEGILGDEHEGPGTGAAIGEDNAMVDHLHLLVQGMRQLQQLQMNKKDHPEAEAVKGSVELQKMPEPGDAAVEFNDWMYVTEQMLGALTDNASAWFGQCLQCAREAYAKYQDASALERLSITPSLTDSLRDPKWFRLERRVLSLLLSAMPKAVKEDTITHRIETVAGVLYRLHVIYQPGGTLERTAILKHLEGTVGSEDPGEVVAQLRRWRRHLARAEEMAIALPDASLQLKGLEAITSKVLEKLPDVKFRLALAKNELRLASTPTAETVLKFYQHLLAELQQVTPTVKTENAKLKGATTGTSTGQGTGGSGTPGGSPKKGKNPCKFFQSEGGCKRGTSCNYAHEFASKADRKQRCWSCGATGHRQQECPTASGGGKGNGKSNGAASTSSTTPTPKATASAAQVHLPTGDAANLEGTAPPEATTSSSTTTATADEAVAQKEEMKKLLREASSMLSKIQLMTMRAAETDQATENLELLLRSAGVDQHGLALLDSGASHPFRSAANPTEFEQASSVGVELADGQTVKLKQTNTGTLLKVEDGSPQAPIVPLGALVQQLGCSISWSKRQGLKVYHPVHGDLKVKMKGTCPFVSELEALKLISEIEDKNLERLQQTTIRSLWASTPSTAPLPWTSNLEIYASTGKRGNALAATMDPSFPVYLETATQRFNFVGPADIDLSDESGWNYLKSLPVNRKNRRRLHGSRWMVHLYDGKNELATQELKKLETEDIAVLEIDVQRSKMYNLKGWNNVLRALLWAGCRGQLEGVLGGPPRNGDDELRQKLMYVWMVAENGADIRDLKRPFLFMEYPGQKPWWKSTEWRNFRDEYQLSHVSLGQTQHQVFHAVSNMNFVNHVMEPGVDSTTPTTWTSGLLKAIVDGVKEWKRWPDQVRQAQLLCKMEGCLEEMTEKELKQWAKHVRDGHVPFNKRCRTCVINAGSGRPHRKVITPSAYVLSVDVAGPFRAKGVDADGKYRYALIGSYCMPRLDGYQEASIPQDFLPQPDPDEERDLDPLQPDPNEGRDPDPLQPDPSEGPDSGRVCHDDDGKGVGVILDEDENFLDEEEAIEHPPSPEDQVDMDQKNDDYRKFYDDVYKEVGDPLEYQTLLYVVPLRSRQKVDVNAAMRRMYLQLRQEGHPVVRVHSDRARELKSAALRQWLYEKDVWITTDEAQTPQQNGRAEAAVKNLKKYTKVLLGSTRLPRECWPLAMAFAAQKQRKRALGQPSDKDPAFGVKVAVKSKVFGTGGSYDLDPRWREGRFVGYSSDVKNGLVVRYDDGTFVTSCHVREGLVEAEAIVDEEPIEVGLPVPSRRMRTKARLALITSVYEDVEAYAKDLRSEEMYDLETVLRLWERIKRVPRPTRRGAKAMSTKDDGGAFYAGCYVHGGVCGVMKLAKQSPNTTAYLVEAAKRITGRDHFGSVAIVENVAMGPHRDSHNHRGTSNIVTALSNFTNGEIWVEALEDEYDYSDVWRQVTPGQWRRGKLHRLQPGRPVVFSPGQWHQTEPWEGDRVALLTYTPRLTNLSKEDKEEFMSLGFNLPEQQGDQDEPEREEGARGSIFEPPDEEKDMVWFKCVAGLNEDQRDLLEELQERSLSLRRLLEEEEILLEEYRRMAKQVTEEANNTHQVLIDMMEQTAEAITGQEEDNAINILKGIQVEQPETDGIDDIEKHLSELTSDLQVVLNVPLDQVKSNLPLWVPAIDKELETLFKNGDSGTLRRITMKDARERERRGELVIVPSKLVFTCKPPNQGAAPKAQDVSKGKEARAKWRRKCRLVLCGNFAERPEGQSQAELYAAGASADSMRVALVLASACYWAGAGSDIQGAFLLAPWPKPMRRYAIVPPKTLILAERATETEAWEVDRALYGLRESPAVWSDFRRQRLKKAKAPWKDGFLTLRASIVDPEVWMILYTTEDGPDVLTGVLVTYVDDLLYLAENQVIIAMHSWLCEDWPSSPLEWTVDGTRYLGVEIEQADDGHFLISQRGYLESLVRGYDLEPGEHARLPCPREWLVDDEGADEVTAQEDYTPEELKRAQKITGELLWVTRSRPDVLFVVTMMASALARRPCHVYRVGLKVMAYLAASVNVQLQLGGALTVNHINGQRQLADLPTKLHSRVRMSELMSAAQEELDKEALRRELEAETASLRRPLTTALGDPPLRRTLSLRTTATQTPPLPEPETRVETRVVYTDRPVPDEVPISMFWKTTDHRSKVHTSRECHGLRILEQCLRQSTATTAKDAGRYSLDVDEGAQAMACMLPRRGTLTGLKTASNGLSGCVLQLHGVICGGDEALLTRDQHIPKM
ncbi:TY5A [Symbiodinium sp. KB8]|nr:TY5A [Symbiodinium sp. KB8]